jgi:hypothetical protein
VPELAIAPAELVRPTVPVVAGLELVIALAAEVARPVAPAVAEVVRPTGPEAEPIDLVVAGAARPIVPAVAELELIALALAAPGNASVAAMFLGAAVPAEVVPLAAEVVG